MEELGYTSNFTGEETDNILENAKAIMEQTMAEDGDTVQVYDTDGVPHKIAKTELLKKSTLALPKLEDISAFVAINAAGDAVGVMTKEQVASVLAELIGIATPQKNGLLSKDGFFPVLSESSAPDDANDVRNGIFHVYGKSTNYPKQPTVGVIVGFSPYNDYLRGQICFSIWPETVYFRTKGDSWSSWKQIS